MTKANDNLIPESEALDLGKPDFSKLIDDDEPTIAEEIADTDDAPTETMGAGDMVAIAVTFGAEYLADRRGDHWRVTPEELKKLSKAVDRATPETELSPAWALLAVSVGMFAPRIIADIHINQKEVIEGETTTESTEQSRPDAA